MSYTLKDYKDELKLSGDFEFEEHTKLLISAIQTPVKLGVVTGVVEAAVKGSVTGILPQSSVSNFLNPFSIFKSEKNKTEPKYLHSNAPNNSAVVSVDFASIKGSELLRYSGFNHINKWDNLIHMESDFIERRDQSPVVRELCMLIDAILSRIFTPSTTNESLLLVDIVEYYFSTKDTDIMKAVIKEGRFTLGSLQMLLIHLRKTIKKNQDLKLIDMYMQDKIRSLDFLLTEDFKQFLQNLEEIRKLRNQLMHDGFKEISGQERAQVMQVWFGKRTFKRFYEKAPPAISPLIELLKERIYVLNDLDCTAS